MPEYSSIPYGGFKVIFDYANYLVEIGNDVYIVYPFLMKPYTDNKFLNLKVHIAYLLHHRQLSKQSSNVWFPLNKRIKERFVYTLSYKNVPKVDLYVCTAQSTAPFLNKYPIDKSRKFYFIQGFENWGVSDSFVLSTYRYPLNKIVISNWLKEIVTKQGEHCTLVPNGFDFHEYHLTTPINKKNRFEVSLLYHISKLKGLSTSFAALDIVKKKHKELKVNIFGAYPPPENLPEWYNYTRTPSHDEHLMINNRSAIYVAASNIEGWGLTVGEAMMCGQAVACTDTLGYKEMAENGRNALISPVGDAEALAENICYLIEHDDERQKLAAQAMEDIKKFSVINSRRAFASALGL